MFLGWKGESVFPLMCEIVCAVTCGAQTAGLSRDQFVSQRAANARLTHAADATPVRRRLLYALFDLSV